MRLHRCLLILCLVIARPLLAANPPDIDEQARTIAKELRCVVCQNLSVADSPSEMAQQMRGVIREQLQAGKTPQQIKNFFVSKYGQWVLLAPSTSGFSLLVWVLPFIVLLLGLGLGFWLIRRWASKKAKAGGTAPDPALLARVRTEATSVESASAKLDLEDSSQPAQLRRERDRLYADLKELEFDYQTGKLSAADYGELRKEIEFKAAAVLDQMDQTVTPAGAAQDAERASQAVAPAVTAARSGVRGWQLAAGGTFLLLFGVALGVALTNSLRPRGSEQGSITGDFLTGTPSSASGGAAATLLEEGKNAFQKQDWPKAIDAFKKTLAANPNQPEAHTYMGFILVQAGHADGALLAFDKALSIAPDFPMALWGKGMTLYQAKQDYAGAREALGRLVRLMPAGQERGEVETVLAEMPKADQKTAQGKPASPAARRMSDRITGKISVDPKLKSKIDSQAVLFIIARPNGGAGGPPLAVQKIEQPRFPLDYTLGSENVMMQGRPFTGKVTISVRLDKDGNPITRQPGDISGEYQKNPVDVGSKDVDIVLDKAGD